MFDKKKIIRNHILEYRENMCMKNVNNYSKVIIDKLIKTPQFTTSKYIMSYIDFRNEVKTRNLISLCFKKGKKVVVPVIIKKNGIKREMAVSEIYNINTDMVYGPYGILQPSMQKLEVVNPKILDLIVVPGIAFDIEHNRLGFGKGYYDKFLKSISSNSFKVGIAYEMQIYTKLPVESHDIKMDAIITEERII